MSNSKTITMSTKTVAVLGATVLLLGGAIGGTLAWLIDTEEVTNTFTYGDINIDLWETDDGQELGDDNEKVTSNDYTILPGVDIAKNPTLTVEADSQPCWLFVEVDDGLADVLDDVTYTLWYEETGSEWTAGTKTDEVDGNGVPVGVYYLQITDTMLSDANGTDLSYSLIVDNTIYVSSDLTKDELEEAEVDGGDVTALITFTAYAVQYDATSINTASDAWAIAQTDGTTTVEPSDEEAS